MRIWIQAIWLGLLLWLASIMTLASDQPVKVYPEYSGLPPALAVADHDLPITLTVRGPRWALIGVNPTSLKAVVDLSAVTSEGTTRASLNVSPVRSHLTVIDQPSSLELEVVAAASKIIPAKVVFNGYPSKGYTVKDFSLSPSEVLITGAPDTLAKINEVAVPIDVSAQQGDVEQDVRAVSYNLDQIPRHNISFSPTTLRLKLSISKGESFATFGIQPVLGGELPEGLIVKHVIVQPATVTLRGDAALLAKYITLKTTPISLSDRFDDFDEEAGLEIPAGLELEGKNLVSVRVLLTTLFQVKTFNITPQFVNLAEGLSVGRIEPSQVKVNIVGKPDALEKILAKDVELVVDLRGTISGLQTIVLKSSDFKVSVDGASIASFEPEQLTLQITKK